MKLNPLTSSLILLSALLLGHVSNANEFDVTKQGRDSNPVTKAEPFLTIQAAAKVAQLGDTVTVHEGVCRERVSRHAGAHPKPSASFTKLLPARKWSFPPRREARSARNFTPPS